jgi:hypothetical protein
MSSLGEEVLLPSNEPTAQFYYLLLLAVDLTISWTEELQERLAER